MDFEETGLPHLHGVEDAFDFLKRHYQAILPEYVADFNEAANSNDPADQAVHEAVAETMVDDEFMHVFIMTNITAGSLMNESFEEEEDVKPELVCAAMLMRPVLGRFEASEDFSFEQLGIPMSQELQTILEEILVFHTSSADDFNEFDFTSLAGLSQEAKQVMLADHTAICMEMADNLEYGDEEQRNVDSDVIADELDYTLGQTEFLTGYNEYLDQMFYEHVNRISTEYSRRFVAHDGKISSPTPYVH